MSHFFFSFIVYNWSKRFNNNISLVEIIPFSTVSQKRRAIRITKRINNTINVTFLERLKRAKKSRTTGSNGTKNRRDGRVKKNMGGFVPVFRDWKLPDTGETRPRRINNHARQRPFANIEAYVTIHCRTPRSFLRQSSI